MNEINDDILDALVALGIDLDGWAFALDAEGDFEDYLLAAEVHSLAETGDLEGETEVLALARKTWPLDTGKVA